MKTMKLLLVLALMASAMVFISCGDDEGPGALALVSVSATGTDVLSGEATSVDLNGATSASGVPVDLVVTLTFSKEVDAATVSATSVSISGVTADVTASGATVTLTATEELARGTDYTLSIGAIVASDGGEFVATSRSFSTGGVAEVTPPNADAQVAYWKFDGDDTDEMGAFNADSRTKITYVTDRFGQAESTASFDGDESLIQVPGADALMDTDDFTLSFWIKSDGSDVNDNDETRGQFVMGLGAWNGFQFEIFGNYGGCKLASTYALAGGTTAVQDLWWSTTGELGWQGWTFDQDVSASGGLAAIIKDKWAHVIVSYDAATKIGAIYINGELRKSQDFNLYGETHALYNAVGVAYNGNDAPGNKLAFGFIQGSENRVVTDDWANPVGFPDNNHFKGQMDDVRVFHASFSATQAAELYNAEKP